MTEIVDRDPVALCLHDAAGQVPRMRPDEWAAFLADVEAQGVLEPLVITPEGTILDGRHRWEAAKLCHQEAVPTRAVNLTTVEQIEYIFRAAVLRRHLSDDQRAVLAARMREPLSQAVKRERAEKANDAKYGRSASDTVSHKEPKPKGGTRGIAAERLNVPERKVRYAVQVEQQSPALAEEVLAGQKTLLGARRELAHAEQAALEDDLGRAEIHKVPSVVYARMQRKFADPIRAIIALEPKAVATGVNRTEISSLMGQLREWCEALEQALSDPLTLIEGGRHAHR